MRRRILQPRCFRVAAPLGQQLAQPGIAELLLARLKARFLQSQPCVVDKAARPGEGAHLLSLRTVGAKFELEALQAFHQPMTSAWPGWSTARTTHIHSDAAPGVIAQTRAKLSQ